MTAPAHETSIRSGWSVGPGHQSIQWHHYQCSCGIDGRVRNHEPEAAADADAHVRSTIDPGGHTIRWTKPADPAGSYTASCATCEWSAVGTEPAIARAIDRHTSETAA